MVDNSDVGNWYGVVKTQDLPYNYSGLEHFAPQANFLYAQ